MSVCLFSFQCSLKSCSFRAHIVLSMGKVRIMQVTPSSAIKQFKINVLKLLDSMLYLRASTNHIAKLIPNQQPLAEPGRFFCLSLARSSVLRASGTLTLKK